MGMFIGFRVDGYDVDNRVPVSTGATREDAQAKAIRRILSVADVNSMIDTVEQHNLTEEQFATVTQITDEWAAKHCGIAA